MEEYGLEMKEISANEHTTIYMEKEFDKTPKTFVVMKTDVVAEIIGNANDEDEYVECEADEDSILASILFQDGKIEEVGVNGITEENLLKILHTRFNYLKDVDEESNIPYESIINHIDSIFNILK